MACVRGDHLIVAEQQHQHQHHHPSLQPEPERRGGGEGSSRDGLPGRADPAPGSLGISDRGLVPRAGPEQIQQLVPPLSVDIPPDAAPVSASGESSNQGEHDVRGRGGGVRCARCA